MKDRSNVIISIVVPVYNVENYLKRCIESILNQTFSDFELILIDDGSTDDSGKICDQYALIDDRIIVLHIKNNGVSNARNKGLEIAKGMYVTFCDSDDYWKNNLLEIAYNGVVINNADYLLFNYDKIENGEISSSSKHEIGTVNIEKMEDKYNYIVNYILLGKSGWEVFTRIFKNDIIKKNKIQFCTSCNNFAEDMGFVINYVYYANIISSVSESLYCYCVRNNSMMQTSRDLIRLNDLNEISYDVGKNYKKIFNLREYKKKYSIIHFLIMYNQYVKIIGNEKYKELSKEISKIKRRKWYFENTIMLFSSRKQLYKLLGKRNTKRIYLFYHYCLHKNWKIFTYESAIFYKFLY